MNASPDCPPRISRFLQILPGLAGIARALVPSARGRPTRMSVMPLSPKVRIDFPVRASMACRKLLTAKISRRSFPSALCQ
jgi:hypothetical protein